MKDDKNRSGPVRRQVAISHDPTIDNIEVEIHPDDAAQDVADRFNRIAEKHGVEYRAFASAPDDPLVAAMDLPREEAVAVVAEITGPPRHFGFRCILDPVARNKGLKPIVDGPAMPDDYVPYAIPEPGPDNTMLYACPACGRERETVEEALDCLARCRKRLADVSEIVRGIEIGMLEDEIARLRAGG